MLLSRTLLAVLIAAFLLVPACTGEEEPTATSDETAGGVTAAVPSETEAAGAATVEVSEAPVAPPSASDDGEDSGDGGGTVAGIDLDADYCEIAAEAEELGVFSDEGPRTPDDLADAADRSRRITGALIRKAPDEIASDVEVAARSLSELLSVLEGQASRTGDVSAETRDDPDVQAAVDALGSQEVQSANDRVARWRRDNC